MPGEPASAGAAAAAPGHERHHTGRRRPTWLALIVILIVGMAGSWVLARHTRTPASGAAAPPSPLAAAIASAESRVAPAVVTLDVESRPRRRHRADASLRTPPLDHSQGSGLIVDARGYILTNRHVVERAARIAVEVSGDPRVYYARLVGADRATDLALVKIDVPHPLPAVPLGNSAHLAVGDWVVAIGSPFGLHQTVTAGIVSALDRSLDPEQQFEHFIQTDAPINPGNSGGPLVNLAGQVVGINTAIYTETDGYQGIGFALPSNLIASVYPELLRHGHVTRGSIGVYFESTLDPAVRRVYGLPAGVPLTEITKNGPAAQAGLRAGDVITSLNGHATASGDALMRAVEFYPIGKTIRVGYTRNGQPHTAELRVTSRDRLYPKNAAGPAALVARSAARSKAAPEPANLGLTLANQPHGRGVRVVAVVPDSFADQIGMQAGDIVRQLDRTDIRNRSQFHRLAAAVTPGQDVALVLRRSGDHGVMSRWLVGGTFPPPLLLSPGNQ